MKTLKYFGLSMSLVLLLGCSEKKDPKTAIPNENLKRANALLAAFNAHDWEKMSSFYTKDAQFLDPAYGPNWVKKTKAALIANYAMMEKSAPDIKDEITTIFAVDDKVSIQFTSSGTTAGQRWTIPISTILTFRDGKISHDASYYDK